MVVLGCCDSVAREKAFDSIDGTPVYYFRDSDGDPHPATFYCKRGFFDDLVSWAQNLKYLSSTHGNRDYNTISFFVSAGAYNCRNDGCVSAHNYGRALDLDSIKWNGVRCAPYYQDHSDSDRTKRRRYFAVDAVTRRWFRYVLDGNYNSAHRDHIHMDNDGLPLVCLKDSTSDTVFVQASCNNFMGAGLAVDGVWDSATNDAFERSKNRLGVDGNPHTEEFAWRLWCSRAAAHGFADKDFGTISFT